MRAWVHMRVPVLSTVLFGSVLSYDADYLRRWDTWCLLLSGFVFRFQLFVAAVNQDQLSVTAVVGHSRSL